jgi:predicted metal-dependent phosphoesterase TrpH
MRARADLHVHSNHSDGLLTPQQLVELAEKLGLSGIALTDHDTLDGIDEFMETETSTDIKRISGVEVSAKFQGQEVHILGYFVPSGDSPIEQRLKAIRESRQTRFPKMVEKLRGIDIEVDEREVQKILNEVESPGRPHLARLLIASGVVKDINEAFKKYLATGRPGYVEREKIEVMEAIRLLRESGAVPVLAHPLLIDDVDLKEFLPELQRHGLEGVEVDYGYRKESLMSRVDALRTLVRGQGLLATGGSDFHGDEGHYMLGSIGVPVETIASLHHISKRIRETNSHKP